VGLDQGGEEEDPDRARRVGRDPARLPVLAELSVGEGVLDEEIADAQAPIALLRPPDKIVF
jgi:hypothetical protein